MNKNFFKGIENIHVLEIKKCNIIIPHKRTTTKSIFFCFILNKYFDINARLILLPFNKYFSPDDYIYISNNKYRI